MTVKVREMYQLIVKRLKKEGADLVSNCDLTDLPQNTRSNLDTGIVIALKLNPEVISNIAAGPVVYPKTIQFRKRLLIIKR